MTRTVRYLSRIVLQTVLTMMGMTALLILFYAVTTEAADYEYVGGVVLGVVSSVGAIFPMLMEMNTVTYYLPLTLSMSVTRRGCFLGLMVSKLEYAAGVTATLVAAQIASQAVFGTAPVFMGTRLVSVLALMVASAALGSTFGMLGLRFGRTLLLILSLGVGLLCGLCGGIIGFLSVDGRIINLLPAILRLFYSAPLLLSIALALLLVCSAIDWRICRHISVK